MDTKPLYMRTPIEEAVYLKDVLQKLEKQMKRGRRISLLKFLQKHGYPQYLYKILAIKGVVKMASERTFVWNNDFELSVDSCKDILNFVSKDTGGLTFTDFINKSYKEFKNQNAVYLSAVRDYNNPKNYLEALKQLYQTLQYTQKIALSRFFEKNLLRHNCAKILYQEGIIKNTGTNRRGQKIIWQSSKPDLEMATYLMLESNKLYEQDKNRRKAKEEVKKEVPENQTNLKFEDDFLAYAESLKPKHGEKYKEFDPIDYMNRADKEIERLRTENESLKNEMPTIDPQPVDELDSFKKIYSLEESKPKKERGRPKKPMDIMSLIDKIGVRNLSTQGNKRFKTFLSLKDEVRKAEKSYKNADESDQKVYATELEDIKQYFEQFKSDFLDFLQDELKDYSRRSKVKYLDYSVTKYVFGLIKIKTKYFWK